MSSVRKIRRQRLALQGDPHAKPLWRVRQLRGFIDIMGVRVRCHEVSVIARARRDYWRKSAVQGLGTHEVPIEEAMASIEQLKAGLTFKQVPIEEHERRRDEMREAFRGAQASWPTL